MPMTLISSVSGSLHARICALRMYEPRRCAVGDESLEVLAQDAPVRARAGKLRQVDTRFVRLAADGRRGRYAPGAGH